MPKILGGCMQGPCRTRYCAPLRRWHYGCRLCCPEGVHIMSRSTTFILAAALLGGCSASVTNPEGESPSTTINPLQPAHADQSQTFAARAQYPGGAATSSQLSAVIDPQSVRIV